MTKGGLERREIYENTKAGFRRNKKHKRDRDFWEAVGKGGCGGFMKRAWQCVEGKRDRLFVMQKGEKKKGERGI